MKLKFKKLHKDAILPTRAKEGDAGLDIYALRDEIIPSFDRQVFDTGIAVEIPYGYEGQIRPRSGLAFKNKLDGFIGTIDAGYRGEIKVILYNTSSKAYRVKKGERIAQLVINKIELAQPEWAEELSDSERGEDGFGSSGK